jgi:hypothetical protein
MSVHSYSHMPFDIRFVGLCHKTRTYANAFCTSSLHPPKTRNEQHMYSRDREIVAFKKALRASLCEGAFSSLSCIQQHSHTPHMVCNFSRPACIRCIYACVFWFVSNCQRYTFRIIRTRPTWCFIQGVTARLLDVEYVCTCIYTYIHIHTQTHIYLQTPAPDVVRNLILNPTAFHCIPGASIRQVQSTHTCMHTYQPRHPRS